MFTKSENFDILLFSFGLRYFFFYYFMHYLSFLNIPLVHKSWSTVYVELCSWIHKHNCLIGYKFVFIMVRENTSHNFNFSKLVLQNLFLAEDAHYHCEYIVVAWRQGHYIV